MVQRVLSAKSGRHGNNFYRAPLLRGLQLAGGTDAYPEPLWLTARHAITSSNTPKEATALAVRPRPAQQTVLPNAPDKSPALIITDKFGMLQNY
tara:strand:- start:203 stop:484 length:282 start_codon:yes stop_codon:yes gene_type:complete